MACTPALNNDTDERRGGDELRVREPRARAPARRGARGRVDRADGAVRRRVGRSDR